jgi:small multidrug resistance family-3 protein
MDSAFCALGAHAYAPAMLSIATYILAAIAEIAGCFAFWAWLRLGKSVWWLVPGVASLLLFAWLLTRIEAGFAGRTYAAYGGIYIAASLVWLWLAENTRPDRWDLIGVALALAGTLVILFGPRAA